MGYTYGTNEATDFSEEVHKTLAIAAYGSSVILAKERGAFEVYDAKREENNPFIQRLKSVDPGLYDNMIKYGRRNIACLTIAPTGTTSLMTQTTSGIEPVFLPVYKRRRKVNPNDPDCHIDYVDETGDCFEEYIVYHHKFIEWMNTNGIAVNPDYTQAELDEIVKKSPYYKATSNDIDWLAKVRMQGRIQKWVDHSISVTINLPNDVSEELVNRAVDQEIPVVLVDSDMPDSKRIFYMGKDFHLQAQMILEDIEKRLGEECHLKIAIQVADASFDIAADQIGEIENVFLGHAGGYEIDFSGPGKSASCCLFQVAADSFRAEVFGLTP